MRLFDIRTRTSCKKRFVSIQKFELNKTGLAQNHSVLNTHSQSHPIFEGHFMIFTIRILSCKGIISVRVFCIDGIICASCSYSVSWNSGFGAIMMSSTSHHAE